MHLRRYPFLRLLLPLVLGIGLGDAFPHPLSLAGHALLLLLFLFLIIRFNRRSWGFGVAVYLLFFGMGYALMSRQQEQTSFPFSNKAAVYRVRICEHPEEKRNSLQLQALLLEEVRGDTLVPYPENPLFLLYMPQQSAADSLRRGDELLIHARLNPLTNSGNPDEFDYVEYMEHKGFSGRAYVAEGCWGKTGHDSRRSLKQVAQDCRQEIVSLYQHLAIHGDELAVLSALTVGEKSLLNNEIRDTYATTGASHVLALSGMHVGLIYGVLLILFAPLRKRFPRLNLLFTLLIIGFLGCFAFITGLSPSVVRSVLMFSLFAFVDEEARHFLKLNVLATTAFFMLLCNPLWLLDVSFQLSFMAIIALTYVQPKLYALLDVGNRPLRGLWKILSLSIAVQLCSAPLLMFYFSRFTFHFLLSNVWIIPSVTIIIWGTIILLLLTPIPFLQLLLAPVVRGLISVQNLLLRWIESLPGASIEGIWLDAWGMALMFLLIIATYFAFSRRTLRNIRLALYALLALAGWHTFTLISNAPQRGIAFYNVRGCMAVHCLTNNRQSWIACADSVQDLTHLQRALAPHWNRLHLDAPQYVAGTYSSPHLTMHNQIVAYAGKRICFVSDNRRRNRTATPPLAVDYLYISRGYRGSIAELTPLFRIGMVITDASLSAYRQEKIANECARLGIAYHNLTQQGALQVHL